MGTLIGNTVRLNFLIKPWPKISSLKCCQIWKPKTISKHTCLSLRTRFYQNSHFQVDNRLPVLNVNSFNFSPFKAVRPFSSKLGDEKEKLEFVTPQPENLTLFQRFKKMMREYWYVVIPVHIVTSTVWFGSFFYAAKCGFDIVPYLEYFNISETIIRPFRTSSLGHIALAYALYKVATPARYTVTLGGTTLAIRFLTKRGLIKPMPSKENIKAMVKQKRDEFAQRNK